MFQNDVCEKSSTKWIPCSNALILNVIEAIFTEPNVMSEVSYLGAIIGISCPVPFHFSFISRKTYKRQFYQHPCLPPFDHYRQPDV